jgi:hypothetical protein
MSVPVRCTGCGFAFKVADHYAGRKGKCPNCSAVLVVSKSALPVAEVLPVPGAVEAAVLTPSSRAPFVPSLNGSRGRQANPAPWFWPLSLGIVAVMVLVILHIVRLVESSGPIQAAKGGGATSLPAIRAPLADTRHASNPPDNRPGPGSAGSSPAPPSGQATAADKASQAAAKQKLDELSQKAAGFEWKPAKADDYKTLASLALAMSNAKDPESPPALAAAADDLFGDIKKVAWTGDHIEAINQYAISHLETPGEGVVFVGRIKLKQTQPNGETALLFQIGSTPAVVTTRDQNAASLEIEGRMLVFGRVTDHEAQVSVPDQPPRIQIIVSHFMVPLM